MQYLIKSERKQLKFKKKSMTSVYVNTIIIIGYNDYTIIIIHNISYMQKIPNKSD